MSLYKLAAALAVIALGAAVVTALAGVNPEVKADPAAAKGAKVYVRSLGATCPQEPWPYGCQWREPTRRLSHSPRSL